MGANEVTWVRMGLGKKITWVRGKGGEVVRLRVVKNNMGGVFGGGGVFGWGFWGFWVI